MVNNKITTVSISETIQLQAQAKGFKETFFQIKKALFVKHEWNIGCDPMSPMATVGIFSIELFLKFLYVIDSFNYSTYSGHHLPGHKVDKLFIALTSNSQNELNNLFSQKKHCNKQNLLSFLQKVSTGFIDWRYAYSKASLTFDLYTLWAVLCTLDEYSSGKFENVCKKLPANCQLSTKDQSIEISNLDDIK